MKTLTLQTKIGTDGKLHLIIPCNLPPGPVEVVVVVQPAAEAETVPTPEPPRKAQSGLFVGKARPDTDIDATLKEVNTMWKTKLQDLHR